MMFVWVRMWACVCVSLQDCHEWQMCFSPNSEIFCTRRWSVSLCFHWRSSLTTDFIIQRYGCIASLSNSSYTFGRGWGRLAVLGERTMDRVPGIGVSLSWTLTQHRDLSSALGYKLELCVGLHPGWSFPQESSIATVNGSSHSIQLNYQLLFMEAHSNLICCHIFSSK